MGPLEIHTSAKRLRYRNLLHLNNARTNVDKNQDLSIRQLYRATKKKYSVFQNYHEQQHKDLAVYGFFQQPTKLAILALLPALPSYIICSFLIYLQHIKLDISGCNRITFQGYRHHWSSPVPMAQLKQGFAILAFLYCGEFFKNSIVAVSDIAQV